MQVFKFGGASIRHAGAIKNMAEIIRKYGEQPLVVVVSAMGKTTRALEDYIEARVNDSEVAEKHRAIIEYHPRHHCLRPGETALGVVVEVWWWWWWWWWWQH